MTPPPSQGAVGKAARECASPTTLSWGRLRRICASLRGTSAQTITYRAGDSPGWPRLTAFCDADFAAPPVQRCADGVQRRPDTLEIKASEHRGAQRLRRIGRRPLCIDRLSTGAC